MSGLGKTIRIYLADGSPSGIRHAELTNWTGQAIVCPRGRIGELSKWEESKRPGVYFLFGVDEEDGQPLAYIGEAESVFARLQTHVKAKEFWDQVVFLTSKDQNLTKAHVKYLESRMIQIARRNARVPLENGTSPPLPSLPRSEKDAMEEFLDPARTLLGALGFSILQPLPKPTGSGQAEDEGGSLSDVRLFWKLPKRQVDAEGVSTDEGFLVYEGSRGAGKCREGWSGGYRKLRDSLLADGALVVDGDAVRLTRDTLFRSPSAAAAVFYGRQSNGRNAWKDKDGVPLKTLEERLASATESDDTSIS